LTTAPTALPVYKPSMQSSLDTAFEGSDDEQVLESGGADVKRLPLLLRNRDFRLLWCGQMTSILGGQLGGLAYPLLALALTHSPAKAGLIPLFWLGPFVLFGLPAGAMVDRWNRKRVMLACDTLRMFGVLAIPIAYLTGHLTIALLYAAALTEGLGFCFFNLAELAAIPQVVPKEDLPIAMATNEAGYAVTNTVGPGIAGALIAMGRTQIAGTAIAFAADAASYVASLAGVAAMRTPFQQERVESDKKSSIWADVREGLVFLWSQTRVLIVGIWTAWCALMFGAYQLAIILLVRHDFHRGAATVGLLFSAGGIGGMIGALIAPRIKKCFSYGAILLACVFVQGVALIATGLAPNLILMAVLQTLFASVGPIWNVTQLSYRIGIIPDALQGRVNAAYRLLIFAAWPIGSAIGGALLEHHSPHLLLVAMGTGALLSLIVVANTSVRGA
jgi:MFS family permease